MIYITKLRTEALWAPDTHMFSVICYQAIRKIPLRFELICNFLKHIFLNKRHVPFHKSIPNGITFLIHYFTYSIVCGLAENDRDVQLIPVERNLKKLNKLLNTNVEL